MNTKKNPPRSATVVPLHPGKAPRESEKKWGKAVMDLGFCVVPSLIFRAQQRLGLNATQLAVLLQLADYWWQKERIPYPSKKTLGDRLGLSPRQIQRYIAELEQAGLVKRVERHAVHGGKQSNGYDLSGLAERLKKLEPEFHEVDNETKSMKQQVTRRGGLKKPTVT